MILDFEDEAPARTRWGKRSVALLLLVLIPIGSTLASNLSLGGHSPIEFGQGIKSLVTCAPTVPIYLKPRNTFVNAAGSAATYKFTGISVEGIQNTCVGYDFVIRAYGQTDAPLAIFDTNKTELRVYQSSNSGFSTNASDGITFTNVGFGEFVANFDSPMSDSNQVYRLTIETFPHDSSMIRYAVGDAGPGGGVVFLTPNSPGNNTGEYFEATTNYISIATWCDQITTDIPQSVGSGIGQGESNSYAILSICSTGAAVSAQQYSGGGYSDWFLPSSGELDAYFSSGLPSLIGNGYWSSTQYDSDNAYSVSWPGRYVGGYPKFGGLPVIAVRSFA